jgi:hypothetical protein
VPGAALPAPTSSRQAVVRPAVSNLTGSPARREYCRALRQWVMMEVQYGASA